MHLMLQLICSNLRFKFCCHNVRNAANVSNIICFCHTTCLLLRSRYPNTNVTQFILHNHLFFFGCEIAPLSLLAYAHFSAKYFPPVAEYFLSQSPSTFHPSRPHPSVLVPTLLQIRTQSLWEFEVKGDTTNNKHKMRMSSKLTSWHEDDKINEQWIRTDLFASTDKITSHYCHCTAKERQGLWVFEVYATWWTHKMIGMVAAEPTYPSRKWQSILWFQPIVSRLSFISLLPGWIW